MSQLVVWGIAIAGAALVVQVVVDAPFPPIPAAGTFGDVSARYYPPMLDHWVVVLVATPVCIASAVIAFGGIYLLCQGRRLWTGMASPGFLIVFEITASSAVFAVAHAWQIAAPSPDIVISKSGIDCWRSVGAWSSTRWTDIRDMRLIHEKLTKRTRNAVVFDLQPIARRGNEPTSRYCWLSSNTWREDRHAGFDDYPDPPEAIYAKIRAAWQTTR